jgi:hypothetical protein
MTMNDSYLKALRLAPTAVAHELGIRAETPVFLSGALSEPTPCQLCSTTYAPLLYAPGRITRAQHYHEAEGEGGIYFLLNRSLDFRAILWRHTGWLDQIHPVGKTRMRGRSPNDRTGIAEAVFCAAIQAWCMADDHELVYQVQRPHHRHPIESGVLLGCPFELLHPGMYVPVCDQAAVAPGAIVLRFQIQGGAVSLQQP